MLRQATIELHRRWFDELDWWNENHRWKENSSPKNTLEQNCRWSLANSSAYCWFRRQNSGWEHLQSTNRDRRDEQTKHSCWSNQLNERDSHCVSRPTRWCTQWCSKPRLLVQFVTGVDWWSSDVGHRVESDRWHCSLDFERQRLAREWDWRNNHSHRPKWRTMFERSSSCSNRFDCERSRSADEHREQEYLHSVLCNHERDCYPSSLHCKHNWSTWTRSIDRPRWVHQKLDLSNTVEMEAIDHWLD